MISGERHHNASASASANASRGSITQSRGSPLKLPEAPEEGPQDTLLLHQGMCSKGPFSH